MSQKIKINERFTKQYTVGESDIYRKFSAQFERLFDAGEMAKNKEEFETIYVPDPDFEDQIERFRTSRTNIVKFCVGYTGIGKSTSIRHCFDLGISKEAFLNEERKEIVFPTFLDGYQISDMENFELSKRIAAVCREFEEKYPEIKAYIQTQEGKQALYNFIRKHTSFILEGVNPVDAMDMDQNQVIRESLKIAYKDNPFEYQANRLKFYITKCYHKFERLVILLDDIESLPEEYQKETIARFLKLHECMLNTDFPQDTPFCINLLISVRPHTYRILRNDRNIETFVVNEPPVLKKKPVDLKEIFKRRFDYYSRFNSQDIGNRDTWKKCYDELMGMNDAFGGKYQDMIENLCFLNIRDSLASYARVFANRFWVQRNKIREDIFTVSAPEYSFNNINVIRALACDEDSVYFGDSNSILPNIFLTTREDDFSIYCLLIIQYFHVARAGEIYGLNARKLEEVKEEWKAIFGRDLIHCFIKSMEFLFEQKILRKSIKDKDDITKLDTIKSLNDDSLLYISPRGEQMYVMFSEDSVLLEMLRENVWRDYDGREYNEATSSELMRTGKQDLIFIDLLDYVDYLCDQEDDILSLVKALKRKEQYKKAFGEHAVTETILTGIRKSLEYSDYMSKDKIREMFNEVRGKVNCLMQKF